MAFCSKASEYWSFPSLSSSLWWSIDLFKNDISVSFVFIVAKRVAICLSRESKDYLSALSYFLPYTSDSLFSKVFFSLERFKIWTSNFSLTLLIYFHFALSFELFTSLRFKFYFFSSSISLLSKDKLKIYSFCF